MRPCVLVHDALRASAGWGSRFVKVVVAWLAPGLAMVADGESRRYARLRMRRGALLGCVVGLAGCGGLVHRLPTLDYVHPTRLDVRVERQEFRLDVIRAGDPSEAVIAQCEARCSHALTSGRYLLRAHGGGPTKERRIDLNQTTRVVVRPGSSVGRGVGIGLTAAGGVAALGLPAAAFAPLCMSQRTGDCPQNTLAIIGFAGLGALLGGMVLMSASKTSIDVTTVDDPEAIIDGQGVGLKF